MGAAAESDSISAKNGALVRAHQLLSEIRALALETPDGSTTDALDRSLAPAAISSERAGERVETFWYALIEGETRGPFGFSEMREMAFSGALKPQTLVARLGDHAWVEADQDEALRFMLRGSPEPASSSEDAPPAGSRLAAVRLFLRRAR